MMATGDQSFIHRLVLLGTGLTSEGGPAREVLGLADDLARAVGALMPSADAHLRSLAGSNSMEINFYPAPEEIAAARLRMQRAQQGDEEAEPAKTDALSPELSAEPVAPEQQQSGEDTELGPEVLPDTTLAVLSLSQLLVLEPEQAAIEARVISKNAAEEIKRMALHLWDNQVTLDLSDVRPGATADPEWAADIVERLDAVAEIKPKTVTVYGFLQGANSGGDGYFELVLDTSKRVPREFGPRRKAGTKISGQMTPKTRRQIREGALWDTEIEARVQVIRREKAGRVTVESLRLMSVTPWKR